MQNSAVPALGVALPATHLGSGYDARDIAYRSLSFWGMLVMITGILALLCSIFAGVPAIVAASIILCECCRGGGYMTRSSAGTVLVLTIISAIISPAILIIYLALAVHFSTGAYVAPIILLLANTLTCIMLSSRVRKHRHDLPEYGIATAVAAPEAMFVAPQAQYPGGYPAYPPAPAPVYSQPEQAPYPAAPVASYGQPGPDNLGPYYGAPPAAYPSPPPNGKTSL